MREAFGPREPVHVSVRMREHVWNLRSQRSYLVLAAAIRAARSTLFRVVHFSVQGKGPVLADRYDAHILRTPAEVRNAVRYVLGNFESHAARRGEPTSKKGWVDPFSSAASKPPRNAQLALFVQRVPALGQPPPSVPARHSAARAWRESTAGDRGEC